MQKVVWLDDTSTLKELTANSSMWCGLEYTGDHVDPGTITKLLGAVERMLHQLERDPSRLNEKIEGVKKMHRTGWK